MSKDFNSIKPYVYWIKNIPTGIKYIGLRYKNVKLQLTPNQDLGKQYFSSGKLKEEFKKNPNDFKIKLIATFDTIEEAVNYELTKTKKIYKDKRYANISSFPAVLHTDEVRSKMSKAHIGKKRSIKSRKNMSVAQSNRSIEHNKKLSNSLKLFREKNPLYNVGEANSFYGKKHNEETKKKMSKALKGKPRSKDHSKKISEALKGKPKEKSHVNKVAKALTGKPKSKEHIRKISISKKGKKLSIKARKNMSQAQKKRQNKIRAQNFVILASH